MPFVIPFKLLYKPEIAIKIAQVVHGRFVVQISPLSLCCYHSVCFVAHDFFVRNAVNTKTIARITSIVYLMVIDGQTQL